jgi:hypothetical protein
VRILEGGPQSPAQFISLMWFGRNLELFGYEKYLYNSSILCKSPPVRVDLVFSKIKITLDILLRLGVLALAMDSEKIFSCFSRNVGELLENAVELLPEIFRIT